MELQPQVLVAVDGLQIGRHGLGQRVGVGGVAAGRQAVREQPGDVRGCLGENVVSLDQRAQLADDGIHLYLSHSVKKSRRLT